jgi:hypothetical protein
VSKSALSRPVSARFEKRSWISLKQAGNAAEKPLQDRLESLAAQGFFRYLCKSVNLFGRP